MSTACLKAKLFDLLTTMLSIQSLALYFKIAIIPWQTPHAKSRMCSAQNVAQVWYVQCVIATHTDNILVHIVFQGKYNTTLLGLRESFTGRNTHCILPYPQNKLFCGCTHRHRAVIWPSGIIKSSHLVDVSFRSVECYLLMCVYCRRSNVLIGQFSFRYSLADRQYVAEFSLGNILLRPRHDWLRHWLGKHCHLVGRNQLQL